MIYEFYQCLFVCLPTSLLSSKSHPTGADAAAAAVVVAATAAANDDLPANGSHRQGYEAGQKECKRPASSPPVPAATSKLVSQAATAAKRSSAAAENIMRAQMRPTNTSRRWQWQWQRQEQHKRKWDSRCAASADFLTSQ